MSGWQVVWETGKTVSAVAVALGGPGLVVYFFKDRRKNKAASTVAERTVEPEVDLKETGAAEARLVYVERAFGFERESLKRQIADRDYEIERQRTALALREDELLHRDQIIARLREQVGELEQQLAAVTRQLTAVRDQLNQLADHVPDEEHQP